MASHLLEQIDDGGLRLGIEHTQLDAIEDGKIARNNRLLLTVFASVFLIAGVWMRNDGHPLLLGVNWKSTVCFVLSGGLSFRILWRILASGRW